MIVLDASTLVSATFNSQGVPAQAVEHAPSVDRVAISEPVMTELLDVLYRPGIARFIKPERRSQLLGQLVALGVSFEPVERVTDATPRTTNTWNWRSAMAEQIISSDADLLVLHPWRGVRILQPADYLAGTEHDA